jgi:hypothetical protein
MKFRFLFIAIPLALLITACGGKPVPGTSVGQPQSQSDPWSIGTQRDVISQRDTLHLHDTVDATAASGTKLEVDLTCPVLGTISGDVVAVDSELIWTAYFPSTNVRWRIGKTAHSAAVQQHKYSNEIIIEKLFVPTKTESWNGSIAFAFDTTHGPVAVEESIDTPNAQEFAQRCQAISPVVAPPTTVDLNRVVLGVGYDSAGFCDIPTQSGQGRGVLVYTVRVGGAADRAGIRAGDVILKVGQVNIGRTKDLPSAMMAVRPGSTVEVRILRKRVERVISVQFLAVDAAILVDNQPAQNTEFSASVDSPALRKELLMMGEARLKSRQVGHADAATIRGVDEQNLARLKTIVKQFGWPTIAMVGADASNVASIIAVNADTDRDFQRASFSLMEPLAKNCEVRPLDFAYIYDRTHSPQRYGTAGQCQRAGLWVADPIEDAGNVDQRREKLGIPAMADRASDLNGLCGTQ